jgi:hypothetical protein
VVTEETMGTAKFIRKLDSSEWSGDARLYALSGNGKLKGHAHVVVSAARAMFAGPETCIFASNAQGRVSSGSVLTGSFRGALDPERALRNAGYDVDE